MICFKHIATAIFMVFAVPGFIVSAHAAPGEGGYEQEARVPLNRIVAEMGRDLGGRFMSAEYNEGTDIYRIIWRLPNGKMQRFRADARSGHYTGAGGGGR